MALSSAYPADVADARPEFARLIRETREDLQLSQEEVSERSGVSVSTISRWERFGANNPKRDELRAVCEVLRIHPAEAAIALGYLTRDEIAPPERTPTPTEAEIIALFADPTVPDDVKQTARDYLRFLRQQRRPGQSAAS